MNSNQPTNEKNNYEPLIPLALLMERQALQNKFFAESTYGWVQCDFLASRFIGMPDWIIECVVDLSRQGYGAQEAFDAVVKLLPEKVIEVIETMLDGTPIVDAEPIVFQHNNIWYRADGTPIED
jgi:hypothetical protein